MERDLCMTMAMLCCAVPLAPIFHVDPLLVLAIIAVASGLNARAVSPRQAQRLMLLIPETAQRFQIRDVFNEEQNLRGGMAYLRCLLSYFKGNVTLVTAAYNAGEKAINRYGRVPPYPETCDYVKKISSLYHQTLHPYQRDLLSVTSPIAAK
ncbi:MAG: lytic transglycosylase domain-containing protein [Burkholderiaceae bacterium]|nr:lytic transglycosylase domain-containing protein [Burkholderiaceae bacterium]